MGLLLDAMTKVVPLGIGVVVGVVGVSNLLRWLLARYEKATLGALLGLLLGAVVGLWPFQQAREPELGERVKGRVMTVETRAELDPEDWPLERFAPTGGQVATSLALIGLGIGGTLLVGRLGASED